LSETADVEYKCSDFYEKTDENGVLWNDPEIGISWPVSRPLLSAKDLAWPSFRDLTERLSRCPAYRP
jgi:dTDP-4-dehydrorhamnose 3,5-epimerase